MDLSYRNRRPRHTTMSGAADHAGHDRHAGHSVTAFRDKIWLTLALMHVAIIAVINFTDLSLGMLMIHLFTFDPEWLPARQRQTRAPPWVSLRG